MNFSKTPQTPEARAREAQTKFIEESVKKVERYFGLMCNDVGDVCKKNGSVRDKYDALAKTCMDYSAVEMGSLKQSLTSFAEHISAVQDYRQAQIDRLEQKVLSPLMTYGTEVKHTQSDLNVSFQARRRELKQASQVENLRNKSPADRHTITQAEVELQKRSLDVARTTRTLEETIDKFESKKVQDLKNCLLDFVKIHVLFHSKALEMYTLAFNDLMNINEEEHLEQFRNTLRPTSNVQERMDIVKTTTPQKTTANNKDGKTKKTVEYEDDDEYDDEDDLDDEDDYDDDEDDDEEYESDEIIEQPPTAANKRRQNIRS